MGYWGYPRYVSAAEKRAKAQKSLNKLKKDNPRIEPILIEGRTLAKSWWGKSWNRNLERYADYSNRIGRGRSYVLNGAVLDLQIGSGKVDALVQGTTSQPYKVTIRIKPIAKEKWDTMKLASSGKLDSLQELLAGKFPEALGEIFMAKSEGLFPSPDEIEFSCSCPDWAYMCKHVAATLYGVGARLDQDPGLFFKLRQVEMADLISRAVEDRAHALLKVAQKKTGRIMDISNAAEVFGIDMEMGDESQAAKETKAPSATIKTKAAQKLTAKSPVERKTKVASPHASKSAQTGETQAEQILAILKRTKKGIDAAALKRKTGFDEKIIRNILYSAAKRGDIERVERGVYRAKRPGASPAKKKARRR
jgi:uncharacterized Zn finger protein